MSDGECSPGVPGHSADLVTFLDGGGFIVDRVGAEFDANENCILGRHGGEHRWCIVRDGGYCSLAILPESQAQEGFKRVFGKHQLIS